MVVCMSRYHAEHCVCCVWILSDCCITKEQAIVEVDRPEDALMGTVAVVGRGLRHIGTIDNESAYLQLWR